DDDDEASDRETEFEYDEDDDDVEDVEPVKQATNGLWAPNTTLSHARGSSIDGLLWAPCASTNITSSPAFMPAPRQARPYTQLPDLAIHSQSLWTSTVMPSNPLPGQAAE